MFEKVNIQDLKFNPFDEISNHWVLISAKKDGVVNTMTASWGQLGHLWGKNVMTVYIRPQRYTKEFVDAGDYFTVTLFDGYKKELGVLGSKSGRDGDKIAEVSFDIEEVENQPDDTVAADMRIFHDGENPLPVRTSSESIEEICQPVFV
jgi:hypothetical protein